MKKLRITALLLVAVMVLTALSGCTQERLAYTVLEFGSASDSIGGKHTSDIPEWSSEKLSPPDDPAAPAEMTVTFEGETYTADYSGSFTRIPNTHSSHYYFRKLEDGTTVKFYINAETQDLTFISIHKKAEQTKTLEESKCREIADAVADNYISLKDYTVKVEPHDDQSGYAYTYYREISGYKTTDQVRIVITDGVLVSCDISTAGAFKDVKSLSIDEKKATSAIEAKLQDIYGHLGTMNGYTIVEEQWVKTPDGQCARLYNIDVNFKDGNSYWGNRVQLLVV